MNADFDVTVPGGRLHGTVLGDGPPLLVLHGGPGLSDYSSTFADELTGWRALTYHQRGPAPSDAPGPYSVGGHVADALAVLDHHGVDRAVVLGHSWGAFLACCLAADAPDRVAALVLVDGLGLVDDGGMAGFAAHRAAHTPPDVLARVAELDVESQAGDDAAALESFRLMWPAYFADPAHAPAPPAGLRMSAGCFWQTAGSVVGVLEAGETAARLSSFTGPVEVVHGRASPMPAAAALGTAALFRRAVVTAVPDAGHLPWTEHPGCVAAALERVGLATF